MNDWSYLTTVADGEPLEIEGVNVWEGKWHSTGDQPIIVPHPNYPSQRHELYPSFIEVGGKKILFAAGELSNCVWCFYVPA